MVFDISLTSQIIATSPNYATPTLAFQMPVLANHFYGQSLGCSWIVAFQQQHEIQRMLMIFPSQVDHRYLKHRGFTVPYSCDLQLLTQSCSQSIHFQVGPVALVDSHYTGCFEFPAFQNQVVELQKLSAHWYSRLDITQLSIPQIFIN